MQMPLNVVCTYSMSYIFCISVESASALLHHVGYKFHEVFQLKQGRYSDLSAAKISEMMKSNGLDVCHLL